MRGNREAPDPSRRTTDRDGSPVAAELVFDLLSDPLRRQVLDRLDAAEGRVDLHDLADRVVTDAGRPDDVAIRLHHVHLPKLDDAGLVAYDPETNTVALTP